jgi:hypothetical protein
MTDGRQHLTPSDRIELLCWLTCGSLGAYYLNAEWPQPPFYVQAAHRWLDRHARSADWLIIAKLSALAGDIARAHAGFVDADWARDAVEEMLDADDLNLDARLVKQVWGDCRRALADKRVAD